MNQITREFNFILKFKSPFKTMKRKITGKGKGTGLYRKLCMKRVRKS